MRGEKEILDMIMSFAENDERIRAVYMNGSRANPNVEKDRYRDYDIVFVVTETDSFLNDKGWINVFGDIAIVQEPDSNDMGWGIDGDITKSYTWLILFKDRNRIDLHIETKSECMVLYGKDSLTVSLMDKDGILPPLPPPSDKGYYIHKPTFQTYKGCCNEFWWCLNNVAKGIKRDQLAYAMWMYNVIVRDMLVKMLDWYIGIHCDFAVTAGMQGKYYKKLLPENLYSLFAATYSDSSYENMWKSIFTMCRLFGTAAPEVGNYFGWKYDLSEEENVIDYLKFIKNQ